MTDAQLIRSIAVLAAILVSSSCRDPAEPMPTASKVDLTAEVVNSSESAAVREALIPLAALDLDPSIQGVSSGEWTVERINDTINKKLADVGKTLADGEPPNSEALTDLISESYQSGPLRPSKLTTVYQDASFVVNGAESLPQRSTKTADYRGTAGFVEALRELVDPFDKSSPIRTHFKIYRITPLAETVDLHLYFELAGHAGGHLVQQRAVWESQWSRRPGDRLLLESILVTRYEESIGKAQQQPLLSDCTAAVLAKNPSYEDQLVQSTDHWLDRIEYRYGIDPGAWLGLAVADVNGDDLEDLYLCQPGGLPNRLFVQNLDGTATDVSSQSGVDWLDHTHAALLVDLDNDSDQDLVLALKRGIVFMSNEGAGTFVVRSTKPIPKSNAYALTSADYDGDGFLDIYVCCYSMRRGEMDRQFIQRPVPYHDANNGGRNVLLRNRRNWLFQDVTQAVGLDQNNRRFSFAASWEDFDNDRDLDLYVANDYGRNNLYRNDYGEFTDVAATAGVEDLSAGMSVTWGDYNNDGWMDLYISNMFSSAGNRIAYQRQFRADDRESTRADFQRHARGNSLFENVGDGTFRDVSVNAGVTMGRWAWGSNFVDINNDGFDDLIVANGFLTQEDTTDL